MEGHLEGVSDEECGKLFRAILRYVNHGEVTKLTGEVRMAFNFIRAHLDRDREKWVATSEKRSAAGAKGGTKSGETRRKQAEANEANASTTKQNEANEAVNVYVNDNENVNVNDSVNDNIHTDGFDAFWKIYPKRVKKQDAIKAWRQVEAEDLTKVILDRLTQFKLSAEWTREDGRFIPYPASWLRGRRWEDEVIRVRSGTTATKDYNESF